MPEADIIVLVGVTFFIAGIVKGIVGFGLPTVALALLTVLVGIKTAIAIAVFPSLLTNIWQALGGGYLRKLVRRLALFMVAVIAGVFIGTQVLALASPAPLALLLGVLLFVYAMTGLLKFSVPALGRHERWAAPICGTINGTVTGLTGTFIMPGVLYLQSLRLERGELVQAMGLMFAVSTAALGGFLLTIDLMPQNLAIVSLAATVPAFAGMWAGRRIGKRLDDAQFQRVFFIGLAGVGLFLAWRSLNAMAA